MKTLQVYLPYPKSTITQRFGDNANTLYASQGLKGHPAYDWGMPYGTPIPNCTADAYCYSIMHLNDPVLMDYRAAFFLVQTDTGLYEVSYGHMSEIIAEPGKTYQVGDVIGEIGNTGPVFVGQHEVTEAEKDAGSHDGAHLHGPQIRPVQKVRMTNTHLPNWSSWYLMDENGFYRDSDGYYYETINRDNGYNGCISLAPFSTETLATQPDIPAQVAEVTKAVQTLPPRLQIPFLQQLLAILRSFINR